MVKRVIPIMSTTEQLTAFAGRKVFVYFNLHKQKWSVRDVKTRRVLCYANTVLIESVVGKVSEAGRQRVIRDKRKNVHAGIVGTVPSLQGCLRKTGNNGCRSITYNPYKYDSFVYRDDESRFDSADTAILHGRDVFTWRSQ